MGRFMGLIMGLNLGRASGSDERRSWPPVMVPIMAPGCLRTSNFLKRATSVADIY